MHKVFGTTRSQIFERVWRSVGMTVFVLIWVPVVRVKFMTQDQVLVRLFKEVNA